MATDPTYSNAKVHMNGPDTQTIESGGTLEFLAGSSLKILDTTAMTATGLEINRNCDASARVVDWSTNTLAVTEALHDSKTIKMNMTDSPLVECTATLPASSGSGARFRFIIGAKNTANYIIKVANATDIMAGNILTNSTGDSPDTAFPWFTSSGSDTITLDGSTTGGLRIGDYIIVEDLTSGVWTVNGRTSSSGTAATPFSATVS